MIYVLGAAGTLVASGDALPPKSPDSYTVRFAAPVISGNDHALPIVAAAHYDRKGSTALFEIAVSGFKKLSLFSSGHVTLLAVRGSNPASFLAALKRALQAKRAPTATSRTKRLELAAVVLDYKRTTGWLQLKLFFGDNDQGEVFLDLNLKARIGDFSLKDPDYGNYVLAQLARVV